MVTFVSVRERLNGRLLSPDTYMRGGSTAPLYRPARSTLGAIEQALLAAQTDCWRCSPGIGTCWPQMNHTVGSAKVAPLDHGAGSARVMLASVTGSHRHHLSAQ